MSFQGEKYKDEHTALDLFKEYHYSNKKKGYNNTIQSAVVSQGLKSANHVTMLTFFSRSCSTIISNYKVILKRGRRIM